MQSMNILDDVVSYAKRLLIECEVIDPHFLLVGTKHRRVVPFPDGAARLPRAEAIGSTVARQDLVGELVQLFGVAEGWMGPAPRPSQDAQRRECLIVYHQVVGTGERACVLYEVIRDAHQALAELRRVAPAQDPALFVGSPLVDAFLVGYRRGQHVEAPGR